MENTNHKDQDPLPAPIALKNGSRVNAEQAVFFMYFLDELQRSRPSEWTTLQALVHGQQPGDVDQRHLRRLSKALLVNENGSVPNIIRNLVESATQETAGDLKWSSPFLLNDREDEATLERARTAVERESARQLGENH